MHRSGSADASRLHHQSNHQKVSKYAVWNAQGDLKNGMLDKIENALGNFWVSRDRAHGRYLRSLQKPESWLRGNQGGATHCCKSSSSRDKDYMRRGCHSSQGASSVAKNSVVPKGFEGAKLSTYQIQQFTRSKSARPAGDQDSALFSAYLSDTYRQFRDKCPASH